MAELRPELSQLYPCENCGQPMPAPLPKGLKGAFTHVNCKDEYEQTKTDILRSGEGETRAATADG